MTSPLTPPRVTRAAPRPSEPSPGPSLWAAGVTTGSRVPRTDKRTPPPFKMGCPQPRDAAPYQGPRGQAGPERPKAPLPGPPARIPPAPRAPAPAQLPGPNPGLWEAGRAQRRMGTGRPPSAAGTP